MVDAGANGNDITRLGELGGGIYSAERTTSRAVGGVGGIAIGLANEPFPRTSRRSNENCQQANQQQAFHNTSCRWGPVRWRDNT